MFCHQLAHRTRQLGHPRVVPVAQALLQSSHMYAEAKHAFKKHGVLVDGVSVDVGAMQQQKANAVEGLTKGIEGLFKKNKVGLVAPHAPPTRLVLCHAAPPPCRVSQVEYVQGWGKLKSPTEVEVATAGGSTTTLATKNVIIATGSEVTPLPGVPVDERRCGACAASVLPACTGPALASQLRGSLP